MSKRRPSIFERKSLEQIEREHAEWIEKLKEQGRHVESTRDKFLSILNKACDSTKK